LEACNLATRIPEFSDAQPQKTKKRDFSIPLSLFQMAFEKLEKTSGLAQA
jgi:hypothetical protein